MLSHVSFSSNYANDIWRIICHLYEWHADTSIVRYSEESDGTRVIDTESTIYALRDVPHVWINCFISRDIDNTYTVHLIVNYAYSSATRDLKAEGFNTLEDAYNGRDTLLLVAYSTAIGMTKGGK